MNRKSLIYMKKGLVLSTVVWAAACSQVNFGPSDTSLQSQSLSDGQQKETFAFNGNNGLAKVDVLFVVDNSGSMIDKQQKLGPRLSAFINSLGNIDWQIGITTTDTSNGTYGIKGSLVPMVGANTKILNSSVANYEDVFKNSVIRNESLNCGTDCPSDDERPFLAIVDAVGKRNTDNAGFFRSGADLAAVVLSDEDESYAADGHPVSPQTVISTVASIFPEKHFAGYGIITVPGDTACYQQVSPVSGKYGVYTAELAQLTGGVVGSICDNDYSSTLASIGEHVQASVQSVTLKYLPIPDSVQLQIVPFDPSLTWSIDGQSIHFNKAPNKGTSITVLYMPHN